MAKKYFLSFVEEMVMNPDPEYNGYTGGRLEVFDETAADPYASEEVRFWTSSKSFSDFREKWDFRTVTTTQLASVKEEIKNKYYEIA